MTQTLLTPILRAARRHNASDVHLILGLPPAFRISGEILIAPRAEPMSAEALRAIVEATLTPEQRRRLEEEREICVSCRDEECGRVRLSIYHRMDVCEMAIRLCNLEIKSAQELMLPEAVNAIASKTTGLVLVTGPTGVGKTTTLNYLIDLINATQRGRIITIEDPVEFEHTHRKCLVTQIEVGTDTRDFKHCLRHTLRLDPDVIVVGEMRDLDTIETALTAAETGHLVLATLHTPSAAGAAERLVSCFAGERQAQVAYQFASTLEMVIAQRLIPTVDRKRRVLATEILIANDAVRNLIREGKFHQIQNVITSSRSLGMHSLEQSLADLYRRGLITYDEAMSNANHPAPCAASFIKVRQRHHPKFHSWRYDKNAART